MIGGIAAAVTVITFGGLLIDALNDVKNKITITNQTG